MHILKEGKCKYEKVFIGKRFNDIVRFLVAKLQYMMTKRKKPFKNFSAIYILEFLRK